MGWPGSICLRWSPARLALDAAQARPDGTAEEIAAVRRAELLPRRNAAGIRLPGPIYEMVRRSRSPGAWPVLHAAGFATAT